MSKIKVINNNDFLVGLRFQNTGTEKLIRQNSFIMLSEEEVHEINSASKLFQKGVIFVENQEDNEKLGYTEKNPNSLSKTEAKKILELGIARMKNELAKITEDHAIKKFVDLVQNEEVELSMPKIKVISEVFNIPQEELLSSEEV